ncbi:MAG: AraC family transcriptional regulator, partial [Sphingobacteriales bacterium]
SMLKDACNALVALAIMQYTNRAKPAEKLTRAETVTKAFKAHLEQHFSAVKAPSDYAQRMHLSTAYLNECVRGVTGQPVSQHIQARIILEAMRLLQYSALSVREIAAALGYDDHTYFSRLFSKAAGMSALSFRNKNRD